LVDDLGVAPALEERTRAAARPALIAFDQVSKSFAGPSGSIEAIRGITLEIRPGEVVTLVGPSGCGKSTLLNMAAGLMVPTKGSVTYAGAPVTGINRRVGYMTQNDHLLPWRTIARNVEVALEIRGERKVERRRRVEELLRVVGLEGFGGHFPTQVSGGMRKRAALARLLAYDPETLLMDEPFGALDAQLRLSLQSELLTLQRRLCKTVLFVTHDLDEAIALADRCVVFSARPGTIRRVIETRLARDRDLMQLRFDRRFMDLSHELWTTMTPELRGRRSDRT
jgi:NitT/TauT family transport system ATP-binding protein